MIELFGYLFVIICVICYILAACALLCTIVIPRIRYNNYYENYNFHYSACIEVNQNMEIWHFRLSQLANSTLYTVGFREVSGLNSFKNFYKSPAIAEKPRDSFMSVEMLAGVWLTQQIASTW